MKALKSFKPSVTIHQPIWRNTAEDLNLLFLESVNGLPHITAIINMFRENLAYDIGILRRQKKTDSNSHIFPTYRGVQK